MIYFLKNGSLPKFPDSANGTVYPVEQARTLGDICKHILPHFVYRSISSKSCKFSFLNVSKLLSLFPVFATAAIV